MFKWVWLIILGLIWLAWLCLAIKDVVITIKWCIKNKETDCLDRINGGTWVFVIVTIVSLFLSSFTYWLWSL